MSTLWRIVSCVFSMLGSFLFSLCISLYISFLCLCCYWCFLLVEFYFIQQRFLLLFTVFWIRKVFPCVFNIVFFKNSFASPIPNEHTLHCITIFFWQSYTQELMPLLGIVVHTCNFSTWEVGAKRSAVQSHPQLYFWAGGQPVLDKTPGKKGRGRRGEGEGGDKNQTNKHQKKRPNRTEALVLPALPLPSSLTSPGHLSHKLLKIPPLSEKSILRHLTMFFFQFLHENAFK